MSLAVESTSKDWTGRRHSVAIRMVRRGCFFPDILVSNSSLAEIEDLAGKLDENPRLLEAGVVLGLIRDLRKHLGRD
jgi:hypothetical protein